MIDEQPAATPAEGGDVATVEEPQVVNLDAPQTPNAEAETPAGGDLTETDDLDALLDAEQAAETEEVEVEYEGKAYKLPPELKGALLRDVDYRKKTMDLAETRKTVERRELFIQAGEIIRDDHANLAALDRQIKSLENADISGWSQEQIVEGQRHLELLKREAGVAFNEIERKVGAYTEAEKAETAKLRTEAIAEAAKIVPKFNDERRVELEQLGVELGISKEDVESITDANAYKVLHYADIGMKFAKRQSQAAKMKTAQAGNPSARVGGNADAGKPPEAMSMSEYIAARSTGKI